MFAWFYRYIVGPIFRLYLKEVSGWENLPRRKAAIYIANHPSHWDTAIMIAVLSKKVKTKLRMIVSRKLVSPEAGGHYKMRKFFYVTLPGSITTHNTVEKAVAALKAGDGIIMYPEGRVVEKEEKVEPKTGMVQMALGAQVPIIPIKISGTTTVWDQTKKSPKFSDYFKTKFASVVIGKPIVLSELYDKEMSEAELQLVANKIMEKLYSL